MTGDATTPPGSASGRASDDLRLRVISAAVLAPLALGAAWLGGWPFLIFWTVAACVIQWEWRNIVVGTHGFGVQVTAAIMVGIAGLYAMLGRPEGIALGLGIGVVLEALLSRGRRIGAAAGFLYAAALLVACMLLRRDAEYGFTAIVFLPIYWPDFDRRALEDAILEFHRRERRFGGLAAAAGS